MSAKTLTQVPAQDLEEGDMVDLNEDYIADPDQDLDHDSTAMVESVETVEYDDESVMLVTFSLDGEEFEHEFPLLHKLKVISEE